MIPLKTWTNGTPENNYQDGTQLDAVDFESWHKELVAVLSSVGIVPDADKFDQLLTAIRQLAWGGTGTARPTTLGGYGITNAVSTQMASIASFDDPAVTESGFALVSISAGNVAQSPSGAVGGFLVVSVGGIAVSAARAQLAIDRGTGLMYLRSANTDVSGWSAWKKIADAATTLAGYGITDAVALAAFTGANQSLATNGYQKLPGGLILQWGSVSVAASTQTTVTLPIAFPNAHLSAQATGTTTNSTEPEAAVLSKSVSSMVLIADYAQTVYWFAIGY